jgi:hypothetical protein
LQPPDGLTKRVIAFRKTKTDDALFRRVPVKNGNRNHGNPVFPRQPLGESDVRFITDPAVIGQLKKRPG